MTFKCFCVQLDDYDGWDVIILAIGYRGMQRLNKVHPIHSDSSEQLGPLMWISYNVVTAVATASWSSCKGTLRVLTLLLLHCTVDPA